jgi:hypothetical protein
VKRSNAQRSSLWLGIPDAVFVLSLAGCPAGTPRSTEARDAKIASDAEGEAPAPAKHGAPTTSGPPSSVDRGEPPPSSGEDDHAAATGARSTAEKDPGRDTSSTSTKAIDPGAATDAPAPPTPADPRAGDLPDPTSESLGGLNDGDPISKAEALFGAPSEKEAFYEEGATGDMIAEWRWEKQGVSITVQKLPTGLIARGVSVTAPSTAKTSRGIGIGSTWAEVDAIYSPVKGKGLNPDEGEEVTWGPEQIIVGSVYGGTFFSFEDGKVTSIFVGAGAE